MSISSYCEWFAHDGFITAKKRKFSKKLANWFKLEIKLSLLLNLLFIDPETSSGGRSLGFHAMPAAT